MEEQIEPGLPTKISSKAFPKYFATVTPLSKFLAAIIFIILPFFGFYLGIKYGVLISSGKSAAKPVFINKIVVATLTPRPSLPAPTEKPGKCESNPCVVNGIVYYSDELGVKKIVAQSDYKETPTAVSGYTYKFAQLSPNNKFISLGSIGHESVSFEVYDISSAKTHLVNATGFDFGYWLNDNRLLVVAEGGMGISNGIFISKNGTEPWIMEKIGDAPIDLRW